jgi:hypothetical protein
MPSLVPRGPATPVDPEGRLLQGRWRGGFSIDPVSVGPRRGRVRRWCYVAAGDAEAAVGAAVVDLGLVAVAFAWACIDGRTVTWETRLPLRRGAWVGVVPHAGAGVATRTASLRFDGHGGLELDVPTDAGRLRADVVVTAAARPVVLATPTPGDGWNCTQKAAGHPVTGRLRLGEHRDHSLGPDAGGWRDWTAGRQDRDTRWRWVAAAGTAADGRRVGLNLSTGMNARREGEDLVWWNGDPVALSVDHLAPIGDPAGPWRVSGPDVGLRFEPWGVRAADENLGLLRSWYVQPIGRLTGTLPDPDGQPVEVRLTGVTEDHHAIW